MDARNAPQMGKHIVAALSVCAEPKNNNDTLLSYLPITIFHVLPVRAISWKVQKGLKWNLVYR